MAKDKPNKGGGGSSHQRTVARTAEGKKPMAVHSEKSGPESLMGTRLNTADSLTWLSILVGIFLVLIIPNLILKVVLLPFVCAGFAWLAYRSHWTNRYSPILRTALAAGIVFILCFISIPQFWAQWKSEHQAETLIPGTIKGPQPTLKSLMEDSLPGDAKFTQDFPIHTPDNTLITIEGALFVDLVGGSEFTAFYIPSSPKTFGAAMFLAQGGARTLNQQMALSGRVKSKVPDEKPQNSAFLPHTGTIYIYHDDFLNHRQMADIEEAFAKQHFSVVLRGPDYLNNALEERRKSMLVPVSQQHTHASWLAPHAVHNAPLFPLHEGEQPTIGLGHRNAGDYPLIATRAGVIVKVMPTTPDRSFAVLYKQLHYEAARTLAAHTDYFTYTTYVADKLTQDDVDKLLAGTLSICVAGSVEWEDETGKYETYLSQCLVAQPDHSFNWMISPEDGAERKRETGSFWALWHSINNFYSTARNWFKQPS